MQEDQETQQITEYQDLLTTLLHLRASVDAPFQKVIDCADRILLYNPDFITAWNIRRTSLAKILATEPSESIDRFISHELAFGVKAIRANPKSYGAWYHRQWIVTKIKTASRPFEVATELKLCDKLLELDARNCTLLLSA